MAFDVLIAGTWQTACSRGDEELYNAVVGKRRIPDKHAGNQLPASAWPSDRSDQWHGVQH